MNQCNCETQLEAMNQIKTEPHVKRMNQIHLQPKPNYEPMSIRNPVGIVNQKTIETHLPM